jgi:hypothetical protein
MVRFAGDQAVFRELNQLQGLMMDAVDQRCHDWAMERREKDYEPNRKKWKFFDFDLTPGTYVWEAEEFIRWWRETRNERERPLKW